MSKTTVTYPIVGAVRGAEEVLGPKLAWESVNKEQKRFLSDYFEPGRREVLSMKEIETLASWSNQELNAFLKKKGFPNLKLEKFRKGEFGVASVLDVLVKWIEEGRKVPIVHDRKEYPGVRLKKGVDYLMSPVHGEAVARVKTKTDDVVYMTMLDDAPDGFDLVTLASQLTKTAHQGAAAYNALKFPMVDLNQAVDINWLKGMWTHTADGKEWKISQAKQQTKLRMNHQGARAQSAVAIGITTTSVRITPPDLVIDRPFLIWFTRPGVEQPLFVGHITPEDWKEPADLETP